MNAWTRKSVLACLVAALAALLAGCGGGDDGPGIFDGLDNPAPQPQPEVRTFWATNLATDIDYQLQANKVGEGTRCYVYLEQGRTVPQSAIDNLIAEFDARIYPGDTGAFGSEPNPGIDGDAKIYILLLDILDTFNPPGNRSYVAGYFSEANEFTQSQMAQYNAHSNEKEMFYMDINPGTAVDLQFLGVLAHEFQHMIHFRQKYVAYAALDDDWLNEAMSEVAPVYCGYGPDYGRVYTFELKPWDSLTIWGGRVQDYAVAYMWAQYLKDRVDSSSGNTIFWRMLHRPDTGIASVSAALADAGYAKDFGGVFRDWAVANYSGNALSWAGHPERSYTTINTWPGIYPVDGTTAIQLPGLFGYVGWTNVSALYGLEPWSVDYYLYTPLSGNTGSVTWTRANPSGWASLGDNTTLSFSLASGSAYSYTGAGYLIAANPSADNNFAGDGVGYTSSRPRPATVAAMLAETGRDATVQRLVAMTGKPFPVCVHPFLREKTRPLEKMGIRPSR